MRIKNFLIVVDDESKDDYISSGKLLKAANHIKLLNSNDFCEVFTLFINDKILIKNISDSDKNEFWKELKTVSNIIEEKAFSKIDFLTIGSKFLNTFTYRILPNSDMYSYDTTKNHAQKLVNDMWEADKTKIPLIVLKDCKFGQVDKVIMADCFYDENDEVFNLPLEVETGDAVLGEYTVVEWNEENSVDEDSVQVADDTWSDETTSVEVDDTEDVEDTW